MYIEKCELTEKENEKVEISGPGIMTGETQTVIVDKDSLNKWMSGELLAQEAFPDLSSDEREFLISGIEIGQFKQFING